jgi:glyoxylase-like metal-dependent hydrolase (beta-lactamase superfamily II)
MRLTFIAGTVLSAAVWLSAQEIKTKSNLIIAGEPEVQVVPVQGNVYMFHTASGNITVQAGKEGALLVDTVSAVIAPKAMVAIRQITEGPILWVINTGMRATHTSGNEAFSKLSVASTNQRPRIIAQNNVLERIGAMPSGSQPALWPNDTYFTASKDFAFNGEGIVVYHMPAAHTDGDSVVFFRRSDVVSVGDLYVPGRYPAIDVANGGSVDGLIAALNKVLYITVPLKYQEGGTYVIPGKGRLSEEADLVEYRDMVTIVRDRILDGLRKNRTLDEIKASKPTLDYDPEYAQGDVPANTFIEAVYRSLRGGK